MIRLSTPAKQKFIRFIAISGICLFVPLLAISVYGQELITSVAQHFLKQEVSRRFEKAGGMAKAAGISKDSLRDKLDALKGWESDRLNQVTLLADYVDRNADKIVSAILEDRESSSTLDGESGLSDESVSASTATIVQKLKIRVSKLRTNDTAAVDTKSSAALRSTLGSALAKVVAGKDGVLLYLQKQSSQMVERLRSAVLNRYDQTAKLLVREIRVFCISNLLIFTCLLALSRNRRLTRALFALALWLAVVTVCGIYFYITKTNWIWSILTRNHLGWNYLILTGVAMGVIIFYHLKEGEVPIDFSSDDADYDQPSQDT